MRAFQAIISDYCIAGLTGVFLLVSVGKILGKAAQPTPLAITSAPHWLLVRAQELALSTRLAHIVVKAIGAALLPQPNFYLKLTT